MIEEIFYDIFGDSWEHPLGLDSTLTVSETNSLPIKAPEHDTSIDECNDFKNHPCFHLSVANMVTFCKFMQST